MDIPIIDLEKSADGFLKVNFVTTGKYLFSVWPILNDRLMEEGMRFIPTQGEIYIRKNIIDCILSDLVSKGYLYKDWNNCWKFDALKFSLNCAGFDIKGNTINETSACNGYNLNIKCIITDDDELCDEIKILPAETIERLQNVFKNNVFNYAIELYKNNYIKDIAGI